MIFKDKTNFTFLAIFIIVLSANLFCEEIIHAENKSANYPSTIENSTNIKADKKENGNDKFASPSEFSSDEFSSEIPTDEFNNSDSVKQSTSYNRLYWAVAILLFTILAGIFVKFKSLRKLRGLFLVISLAILGFYRGGPGVISSFQNTYLLSLGVDVNWQAVVLFTGLLPITYFFGRVFCGWICYLGALQEFLYFDKIQILKSEKAQKVMRIIRTVLLIILIIQLTINKMIIWNKVGPFRVAVNLFSTNITGYILLGIVLVSSVFIYRPFCKTVCPVGLLHGYVSKIPGASVLGINDSCAGCKICSRSCNINAITRDAGKSKLDNQECIRCGDCLDNCRVQSISLYKKGEEHEDKIILKGN